MLPSKEKKANKLGYHLHRDRLVEFIKEFQDYKIN